MRGVRMFFLPVMLLVAAGGCSHREGPGDIVYTGWNDLFVIDTAEGKISKKIPVGARINDIEPAGDDRVLLATVKGLVVVDPSASEVTRTVPLGILDSVEYDEARNLVYVLQHPGQDPDQSKGPHKIFRLSGDDYRQEADLYLEPWTYDIFLSPSGKEIYVTHLAGRTVTRVDTERMEEPEKIWFGEGEQWEERMVLVRHIAFSPDGSAMYVLEQGEASPTCLWRYSPDTGEMVRNCLGEKAKIQGMVVSPDGSRIFANGLSELVVFDSAGKEVSRTPLGVEHRWIAMSGDARTLYLTADPAEDKGLITCVDTQGNIVRELEFPSPMSTIALAGDREQAAP